jgi:hypothetical protein
MMPAFICREHGLMRRVSEQVIGEVNFQRQGKQYANQEAAIKILGCANKGHSLAKYLRFSTRQIPFPMTTSLTTTF